MTFVAARRFGQRVILVGDTAISSHGGILRRGNESPHAHDYVPGRLKIFPLSSRISVGYAGASGLALAEIRKIRLETDTSTNLNEVLEKLSASSAEGIVEYLLVSHVAGPQIFKVRNGIVSGDQPNHWIGDSEIVPLLSNSIEQARVRGEHARRLDAPVIPAEYGSADEHLFISGWQHLLLTAPTLSRSVGGIPTIVLGSPYGHCFQTGAGAYNPSLISIQADGKVTNEDGIVVNPNHGQYSFSAVAGSLRGAPVLGIWLSESETALLYDPIFADDPERHSPSSIEQLGQLVSQRAALRGGVESD